MDSEVNSTPNDAKYKFVPPDGGWGYVATVSFIVIMFVSVIPWTSFGIYYGPFLVSINGDETNGTFMMASVLMAVMSFTGFAASFLLKKYNIRMVGLIGAISYSAGGFSVFFATNMASSVFSYSLLQGFGYGLLLPASFTILNSYFDKKLSLVMSISQMIIIMGAIVCPLIMSYIVEHLGFRNVILVLAGLSLLNFPAVATFRPVKRYLRKEIAETSINQGGNNSLKIMERRTVPLEFWAEGRNKNWFCNRHLSPVKDGIKTVVADEKENKIIIIKIRERGVKLAPREKLIFTARYMSNYTADNVAPCRYIVYMHCLIIVGLSIADTTQPTVDILLQARGMSIMIQKCPQFHLLKYPTGYIPRLRKFLNKLSNRDTIGLRLFGDPKYLNMAIGLAISSNTDFSFTTYISMFLNNLDFSSNDIAMITMSYFCCDLVARILYSFLCYFRNVNNRTIFLTATFVVALFRIAFVLCEGYTWKIITIGLVGFSRGFIETPLSLVVSAIYKDDFSTAYSLYLVIAGCLGLIFGAMTSYVKNLTQSDAMIIYFFATANFIACLGWITESLYGNLCGRKHNNILES